MTTVLSFPRRHRRRHAVLVGMVLLTLVMAVAGCSKGKSTGTATTSVAAPTSTSAGPGGLAGGSGETSTPSRSTIITTPTPTLNTSPGAREIDKACPYASNEAIRDAEGDRTNRSVQLASDPVGCRYYFEYDPTVVIAEITIARYGTATEAFNAVVGAAKNHPELVEDKAIGQYGSISIKLPLQGTDTWACIFSKGNLTVIAHSRQTVVGEDARNIARLIAPSIP
ncbi:hypothetical protein BH10ACT8_BH10ACT8_24200 [soil metagenome]